MLDKLGATRVFMNILVTISAISAAVFLLVQNHNLASLIFQPTAIIIVIGGTFVASAINFSIPTITQAFKSAAQSLKKDKTNKIKTINETLQISHYARHNSLLDLKDMIEKLSTPFLKRGLTLAIDVENPQLLHDILSAEISYDEEQELINSRVFEAMGGYAPTFGVVGAVLGLIQAMSYIASPEVLGNGISTAFIATLYGVGIANLIFLPIAGKMKYKLREEILFKEALLQAIISITVRENTAIIEEKLIAYLKYHNKKYPSTLYQESHA